jgi:hypothetical protein
MAAAAQSPAPSAARVPAPVTMASASVHSAAAGTSLIG